MVASHRGFITETPLALLSLMRLASPALPVGAYAYSQGMESAVAAGLVYDRRSACDWMAGVLESSLAYTDLAALQRLSSALCMNDVDAFLRWNEWLLASRETAELHFEDTQIGAALWRVLETMQRLPVFGKPRIGISFAAAFALAGHSYGIGVDGVQLGYGWSWLENQVAAATKLVPLGQTDAQHIIEALQPCLRDITATVSDITDEDMGLSLPSIAHLSATHETLYTRLFRS
jgi:urease accessory protein